MAENPVATLARLLGGVVLLHGRLGHQVLGQMLILGTHEVAVAGATVVVAATSRQRDPFAQAALRTVAPALAVRILLRNEAKRMERRDDLLSERERRLEERTRVTDNRERDLVEGERQLDRKLARMAARLRGLDRPHRRSGRIGP